MNATINVALSTGLFINRKYDFIKLCDSYSNFIQLLSSDSNHRNSNSNRTEVSPDSIWILNKIFLSYSLLREAEPISIDSNRDTTDTSASTSNKGGMGFVGSSSGGSTGVGGIGSTFGHCDPTSLEERQLLGRYGVWLLVGLCTPNEDTPVEILGRLLSMLFHWFHVTAYCFDGIEKRLIHLIFSVGNLTLCIYIHFTQVDVESQT